MSNTYKIEYSESGDYEIAKHLLFNPSEFVDYESEDVVKDAIYDEFYDEITYGDVTITDTYDVDLYIPQEFWDEWNYLKELSKKL